MEQKQTLVSLKKESYQVKVVKRFHVKFETDVNIALHIVKKLPTMVSPKRYSSAQGDIFT